MSGNNKDVTSTLQSALDQASGAAQSVLGSITGNTADKQKGEDKKALADAEHDISHAAAKGPGFAVSSTGIAKDDPNRTTGSWNQNVGALKEGIGGLTGAEGLRQEGIRQNEEGKAQQAQGQLSDLGKGVADRVGGTIGGAVAGITGNPAQKSEAQKQHDEGKTRQRGVEAELQNEAEKKA